MARYVILVNEQQHRVERIKVGFSWVLLFWTWLFALPLFIRRVYTWALAILSIEVILPLIERRLSLEPIWIINETTQGWRFSYEVFQLSEWSGLIVFALSVYLGFRGNEITGRYFLNRGWEFADPDSQEAIYARSRWHMPT